MHTNVSDTFWITKGGGLHLAATPVGASAQSTISTGDGLIKPGRWYHFATVLNADTMTLYLDGEVVPEEGAVSFSGGVQDRGDSWILGRNPSGGSEFKGWLDEIAVYDSALSAQYIAQQYALLGPPRPLAGVAACVRARRGVLRRRGDPSPEERTASFPPSVPWPAALRFERC